MGAGADWLGMTEEDRSFYRKLVADRSIDPSAVALTASILRRHYEAREQDVA